MQWKDLKPLARLAGKLLREVSSAKTSNATGHQSGRVATPSRPRAASSAGRAGAQAQAPVVVPSGQSATDFDGLPEMRYRTKGPGGYESGQMVWTWVAYEEDATQGKDRPVLLIGSDAGWLLGTPATSKDHDRDKAQEARAGRYWVEIGRGEWDKKNRVSEVRTDRIVRIDPTKVRRPAGYVPEDAFQLVAAGIAEHWDD